MEQLRGVISFIADILKHHKKKLAFVIASAFFFFILIFPYDDLSDLITTQVAKMSRNQVFIQFENLGVKLFPTLGFQMEQVELDLPHLPTLKASSLAVTPSIASLIILKPGFDLTAENLFGGELDLSYRTGKNLDGQDLGEQEIQLEFENLNLSKIKQVIDLPIKLSGQGNINLETTFDPSFKIKPTGEITITFKQLTFPSQTIQTQMGPIVAPKLEFSPVELNGRLANDKLKINKMTLGNNKNQIFGEIKGEIGLRVSGVGAGFSFNPGGYTAEIDINVDKSFEQSGLGPFLSFYNNYAQPTNKGKRYHLKVESLRIDQPPRIQKL